MKHSTQASPERTQAAEGWGVDLLLSRSELAPHSPHSLPLCPVAQTIRQPFVALFVVAWHAPALMHG